MLERIRDALTSTDWNALLEPVSNDRLVAAFTHPYGLAALAAIWLISILCKWRIVFVAITGALMVSLLVRYTLVGDQVGPDRTVFLFAGGGIFVGAFIIYYLFIRED